jgi:preprotein translocase subunit SecE
VNIFKFVQEVRTELMKVTWPTRAETIRLTLIVLGISAGVGIYLGGLDLLFTQMLKLVLLAN